MLLTRLMTPRRVLVLAGTAALAGLWWLMYVFGLFFTEASLVGYYCCVTEQDLPPSGSLARNVHDFFRTPLGSQVPSLALLAVSVGISAYLLRRRPLLHVLEASLLACCGAVFLSAFLSGVGWQISEWVNGPQLSAYKGFERTVYVIVLQLLLWMGYVWALLSSRSPLWRRSDT
jgi:hypothetical protein